jgi:TolB protein
MKKLVLQAAAVATATAFAVVPAQATFKGTNGLLVYQAQAGSHVQLFTIRPDGSRARQLTHFADSDAIHATWSPDNTKIAFVRQWSPNKARLYTMNADGTGLHALFPSLRGQIAWLPDGKHLLVISGLHWTIVTSAGTQPRFAGMPGSGDSPCILPDGKRAVFIASVGRGDGKAAVFVAQIGGGPRNQHRISPWLKLGEGLDCSPDGTQVAFNTDFGPPRSGNVFTVGVDGTGLRQVTHATGGTINEGLDSYSPDGKKLAFVSNRTGTYEIYSMNRDGTGVTQITHGPEAHAAKWGSHS